MCIDLYHTTRDIGFIVFAKVLLSAVKCEKVATRIYGTRRTRIYGTRRTRIYGTRRTRISFS